MSQPNVEKEAGPPAQSDTPVGDAPVSEKKVREYKDFGHEDVKPTRTFLRLAFFTSLFGLDLHFIDANIEMSRV
jgi:hypothetical protein